MAKRTRTIDPKKGRMKADAGLRARYRIQEAPELTKVRFKIRQIEKKQDRIDARVKELGRSLEFDDIPKSTQLKMYALFVRRLSLDRKIKRIRRRQAKKELRKMEQKEPSISVVKKFYAAIMSRVKKKRKN